mgnify:CR=1 FL=1
MANIAVQFPIDDALWNDASKVFEERGTNIFDAIKGFLKKTTETKRRTTSLEAGRKAFFTLREQAAASNMQDTPLDEINRYISLSRKGM